ncbi:hypothetical protein ACLBXO_08690 [Methylobacterium sp. C33D]
MLVVVTVRQVSRFEGSRPIFTCGGIDGGDREMVQSGMTACLADAGSQAAQSHCIRPVHILSCTDERWR